MKKLISMMLMLCAFITFSACSSDDNGPTNPVSNAVVPTSAKIGAEVTVQGSGFAAGQTLYLQPEQGTEVNTNAKMSSTLTGIGFAQGDKIVVGDKTLETTVTTDGVKVTIPADLAEGEYAVSLVRGNASWELGKVYAFLQRHVESITITDNSMLNMYAPMLGLQEGILTLNMSYNEDGTLKEITSNGSLGWVFNYNGKTVSVENNPYTYTLDDQGRVISSTGMDMMTGEDVTYTWSYDANGYLTSVKQVGAADDADVNFLSTYTDGNLSAYTLSLTNEFTTNKSIRTCPNTVEPYYLLNTFSWLMSRDDLFLGFLLNRNVKVSTYVPNQLIASDIDYATGGDTKNTVAIEKSFENNCLTLKTTGGAISQAQAMLSNTVVIKYQNK